MSRSQSGRRRARREAMGAKVREGPQSRPPIAASKVSITVDAKVLLEVRRLLRKTGQSLSAHVSEALARDLRHRRLQQLIEEYEAAHGVITEDELAELRTLWRA